MAEVERRTWRADSTTPAPYGLGTVTTFRGEPIRLNPGDDVRAIYECVDGVVLPECVIEVRRGQQLDDVASSDKS